MEIKNLETDVADEIALAREEDGLSREEEIQKYGDECEI